MNKTTTLLVAAGMLFLAGCKTEIMKDRTYNPPVDDPADSTRQAQPVPRQRDVRPLPPPADAGLQPMNGEFSNDGIEEETPRRRPARKAVVAPRKGGQKAAAAKGGVYVVKKGDTLGSIARRHGVSVNALRSVNNRTAAQDRTLSIGTKLTIPAGGAAVKKTSGKPGKPAAKKPAAKVTGKLNADGTYTMVKGDNIPRVARKFGIRAKALQAANNLSDEATTKLQIGHKLIIPTGADAKIGGRKKVVTPVQPVKPVQKPVVQPQQPAVQDQAQPQPQPAQGGQRDGDVTTELPPDSAVDTAANDTKYVSTSGYASLEEFARKHNTTVEVLRQMNPRLNPAEPLSNNDMLYVPNK